MTFPVSTRLFYERGATAMGLLDARADQLQTQISTGKRLAAPSDDSVAYSRLQTIARDTADAKVGANNLDLAQSVLAQADTALTAITAQLQRASELTVRARSGSMDATGRQATADELDEIINELVSLGNAQDARGAPLFGGADGGGGVIPNADGSFTYAGTAPSPIPTGNGQSVQPGDTAARIFKQAGGDTLTTIRQLSAALRSNTNVDATAAATVDGLSAASTQALSVQASLGARAARVEVDQAALKQTSVDREALRSGLEDTDVTAAITELQKTMTILSATQASFTKLQGLSLFNYLK